MPMKTSKKTDNNIVSFIEKQTDMPPVSISDLPYIEISGQNHVEIDGIQKILEYKEEVIKIRFKHITVSFNGRGLNLRDYNKKNAVIVGNITSIEFE